MVLCGDVGACWFRPGTCRRVGFDRAGRDGAGDVQARWFLMGGDMISALGASLVLLAGCHARCHRSFSLIFATTRCRVGCRSIKFSGHSLHPEPELREPSTLVRMVGLDLNAPLEDEADAPGND